MKCLVSGATGFIGRELCASLDAEGISFVALSRSGTDLASGQASHAVDLATGSVPAAMLADVDVVFHLAGIAHQRAEPAAYERVNHKATLDLAAAAAAAGVKTFIYLSSVKAMGPPLGREERTEDNCHTPVDAYGLSKRQAELDLKAAYSNSDMSVIILRPALVYGVGVSGNLQTLAAAVRTGIPRPPELGGRSMIALTDLVLLLRHLAMESPQGFHAWIVCDAEVYSARRIHDLLRAGLNRSPARGWLPVGIWRLLCVMRDLLVGTDSGSTFDKIFGTELYSAAALKQDLNWRPTVGLADVAGDIMASYLHRQKDSR